MLASTPRKPSTRKPFKSVHATKGVGFQQKVDEK